MSEPGHDDGAPTRPAPRGFGGARPVPPVSSAAARPSVPPSGATGPVFSAGSGIRPVPSRTPGPWVWVLAVVAVVALGVGAFVVLGGDSDDEDVTSGDRDVTSGDRDATSWDWDATLRDWDDVEDDPAPAGPVRAATRPEPGDELGSDTAVAADLVAVAAGIEAAASGEALLADQGCVTRHQDGAPVVGDVIIDGQVVALAGEIPLQAVANGVSTVGCTYLAGSGVRPPKVDIVASAPMDVAMMEANLGAVGEVNTRRDHRGGVLLTSCRNDLVSDGCAAHWVAGGGGLSIGVGLAPAVSPDDAEVLLATYLDDILGLLADLGA